MKTCYKGWRTALFTKKKQLKVNKGHDALGITYQQTNQHRGQPHFQRIFFGSAHVQISGTYRIGVGSGGWGLGMGMGRTSDIENWISGELVRSPPLD